MEKIKLGKDVWVGKDEKALVIAEIGSNHGRDLGIAKEMICAAREAGADIVKFQLFRAETLYAKTNPAFPIIQENELPFNWLPKLAKCAEENKVMLTATPFDKRAVDLLHEINVPFFKWASPEIHDLPLLAHAASKKRPIILSTGMCNWTDVQLALDTLSSCENKQAVLLHCVSLYPTTESQVNLRMMDCLRETFALPVGFSDHTMSTVIAAAAVARGACMIEKHFTLDRKQKQQFWLDLEHVSVCVS